MRIRGPLALDVLQRSLDALIQRHTVLRTTFSTKDGEPRQSIAPLKTLPLRTVDLRRQVDPEDVLDETLRAEARRPFRLMNGTLIRATLVRIAEHDNVLAITMHHSVCDGWSLGVLQSDLAAIYTAYRAWRAITA